jgi:antitoxin (DNA-binding transcriptional repressor) of toxin-antitoxin stability system
MKNKSRTATPGPPPSDQDAKQLQASIRALGDYRHILARPNRGHLVILGDEEQPVARLTPIGSGHWGLSFMHHTGRWEPMPFSGPLQQMADAVVSALSPYLARYEFPLGISGSDP